MIALLDYGAGNLRSVANALTYLGAPYQITEDPGTLAQADKVVFPGVGAAASCMRELHDRGLVQALRSLTSPVLGICLGMQALGQTSAEGGEEVKCLGVLPAHTVRFAGAVKLPQIGWNTVSVVREDPLLSGIATGEYFYFLHAYRLHVDPEFVLAVTEYGDAYPSIVRTGNFWGVQFHPEKSGPAGLRLLRNFVERC